MVDTTSINYNFISDKDSLQQFCNDLRSITVAPKKTGASCGCIPHTLYKDVSDHTIWFNYAPDSRDIHKFDTSSKEWLLSLSSDNGSDYSAHLKTLFELLKHYPNIKLYFCYFSPEGLFTNDVEGKSFMPSKDTKYVLVI